MLSKFDVLRNNIVDTKNHNFQFLLNIIESFDLCIVLVRSKSDLRWKVNVNVTCTFKQDRLETNNIICVILKIW